MTIDGPFRAAPAAQRSAPAWGPFCGPRPGAGHAPGTAPQRAPPRLRTSPIGPRASDAGRRPRADVALSRTTPLGTAVFQSALEDQDGLLGHQPTCVILKQPSFHAVLRSSYPHPGRGSDESTPKDRNQGRKGFAQNRLRPMKAYECNSGEDPDQDESQGRSESPAPKEGIPCTYISIRGLLTNAYGGNPSSATS